ncbi:MAG: FliG C-terminal domain-containing protein [Thermoguttaceae bacterium]|jgi:flagellar motor switch protein FliG
MPLTSKGIRKAAILIASLDQTSADRLLDQMDVRQAQQVRQAVFELGDVDPAEQKQIIDEFFRLGPLIPPQQHPGIELDAGLAQKIAAGAAYAAAEGRPSAADENRPFRALQQAEDDKLAKILVTERPQTIALVLAHLAPEQASGVLARFPAALQVEVLRRLATLEEAQPEILQEVEQALTSRLSEQVQMQRRRVAGVSAVAAILEASGQQAGMQLLDNLTIHDRSLAEKLGPERIEFAQLVSFDDRSLEAILGAAEPDVVELALVGAPPALIDRILRFLPEAEAQQVRRQLDHPGPTRLSDVEEARQRLAELARRLTFARRLNQGHRTRAAAQGLQRAKVAA